MKKSFLMIMLLSGTFLLAGCSHSSVEDVSDESIVAIENTETTTEEEFTSTMESIFKKGGKMTCNISTNENGMKMNGKFYIDGKKMRTDAEVVVEGQTMQMNTLIKDKYSYTWSNKEKKGLKFVYDQGEEEDLEIDNDSDSDYEDEKSPKMSFKCKKGVEDDLVFDLPKDVIFSEMPQIEMPLQ